VDDELDEGLYGHELRALAADGLCRIIECGTATTLNEAMLWRLKPLWDSDVEVTLCRDLDSLPTFRDRMCVEGWLPIEKYAIIGINDSVSHTAPLMGGMCGFRRWVKDAIGIPTWEAFIERAKQMTCWATPNSDQNVLENLIWRMVGGRRYVRVLNEDAGGNQGRRWYDEDCHYDDDRHAAPFPDDHLMPHLGASGFDAPAALEYWKECGDQDIEWRIQTAEGLSGAAPMEAVSPATDEAREPVRRVILGCDRNLNYATTLPMTCAIWKHRIGYTPSVFLIGTKDEWAADPRLARVVGGCSEAGAEICWIGNVECWAKEFKRSTFAQVVRLMACAYPWPENDYLLTADAEMWGLNVPYFNRAIDIEKFDLYSPDCYAHEEKHRETMNYLGGTVRMWRKLMGQESPTLRDSVNGAMCVRIALIHYLRHELGGGHVDYADVENEDTKARNWLEWNFDEVGFTMMLDRTDWFPDRCRMLGRTPSFWECNSPGSKPVRRVERAETWDGTVEGKIDANLPYLGTKTEVRARCLEVFLAAFEQVDGVAGTTRPRGKSWGQWARAYCDEMAGLLDQFGTLDDAIETEAVTQ